MKIALLLSANIKLNPYVEIFRKVIDEKGIKYDVISWDRESLDENDGIVYQCPAPNTRGKIGKMMDYYKFSCFAKKIIRRNKYDKLIVFGAAIGVFMYEFLFKHYKNSFWFDYRDLTIEQSFMNRFKKVCDISEYISISSPGFMTAFPAQYDFILSHNFDINEARETLARSPKISKNCSSPIIVSTIGGIRDFNANQEVIDNLKDKDDFQLHFIGKGPSAEPLLNYVIQNKIQNVHFQGFYLKADEWRFYQQTDLVNIYYPRIKSHETALSNRFYKSLIFRKPMIVSNRSTQGDYVEKYQLGLSVEDCLNLPSQIKEFLASYNPEEFANRCDKLLEEFVADYDNFYFKFTEFIKK